MSGKDANHREPPDWRRLVREGLPDSGLAPEAEAEVVEELAQLLEDASAGARFEARNPQEVDEFLRQQVPAWNDLRAAVAAKRKRLPAPQPKENHTLTGALGWTQDLRQAWRRLAKAPGFTAVAVLATGLGIGLATAMFSLVNYALLRPLPVERPGELVNIYSSAPNGFLPEEPMAYPDLVDLQEQAQGLSEVTGSAMTVVAVELGGEARLEVGTMVTGNYFEALGVEPALGRLLGEEDDRRSDPSTVVVLDHTAWQRLFSGAPEAIGSTIRVNGHPLTVIGVLPEAFGGLWPTIRPQIWAPLALRPLLRLTATTNSNSSREEPLDNRGHRWLWGMGRLAPGVSFEQAQGEVEAIAAGLREVHPESNEDREFVMIPARDVRLLPAIDSGIKMGSAVVLALVGLVLLIACANVGNLLLARALSRRQEMATRLSLGASRRRILRQLLVEGLLLAALGAAVGVAVALVSNSFLNRLELPAVVPLGLELQLDWRVLLFAAGLAGVTSVLFALAPAAEALRADLISSLRQGERGGTGRSQRLQSSLVLAQVCLSLVLLVCAGLTARSLLNAHKIDLGFDPQGVVTASLDPELQGWEEEEWLTFYQRVQDELSARPEIEGVAFADHLPLSLAVDTTQIVPWRDRETPEKDRPTADEVSVGAGYLETVRTEIVQGRSFELRDGESSQRVAVVNETLARTFWPEGDAVGSRFVQGDRTYEVIGVARDGKYRTLGEKPRLFFYRSLDQGPGSFRTLVVRFEPPQAAAPQMLREVIHRHGPGLAVSNLGTLEQAISPALVLPKLAGRLFAILGGLGLFLAATGLYGVLAYSVARRTHEIGLRMAIGARRRDVLTLILRKGLGLTAPGLRPGPRPGVGPHPNASGNPLRRQRDGSLDLLRRRPGPLHSRRLGLLSTSPPGLRRGSSDGAAPRVGLGDTRPRVSLGELPRRFGVFRLYHCVIQWHYAFDRYRIADPVDGTNHPGDSPGHRRGPGAAGE